MYKQQNVLFLVEKPAGAHPVAPNLENTDSVYAKHRYTDSVYVIHRNLYFCYIKGA